MGRMMTLVTLAALAVVSPPVAVAAEATSATREMPASLLAAFPDGDPPDGGWPVMVLLHGYGTTKEDFSDVIEVVSRRGVVAFSLDAPTEIGEGRRSWGRATIDAPTHAYLQDAIASMRDDPRLDWDVIHVGGFSQGAGHAISLATAYPAVYGGILSVSPAGGALPDPWDPGDVPHPLFLIVGDEEGQRIQAATGAAASFFRAAGAPVVIHPHEGGHHFPPDWVEVVSGAVDWILADGVDAGG